MVNTFLKYLLISGAISMIDFDNFLSSKRIVKYIRKKLTQLIKLANFIVVFTYKKHPRGTSIHEIKESFPLKPSLILFGLDVEEFVQYRSFPAGKVNTSKIQVH